MAVIVLIVNCSPERTRHKAGVLFLSFGLRGAKKKEDAPTNEMFVNNPELFDVIEK